MIEKTQISRPSNHGPSLATVLLVLGIAANLSFAQGDAKAPSQEKTAQVDSLSTDPWLMSCGDLKNRGQSNSKSDATEGRTDWSLHVVEAVTLSPLYEDGILYLADAGTRFYAIDLATRKRLWETKPRVDKTVAENPLAAAAKKSGDLISRTAPQENRQLFSYSAAVLAGDVLVGATQKGLVFGVNKKNGEILWEKELGTEVYSSLRYAKGKVMLGTLDCRYLAMDPKTGQTLWTYETGEIIGSTPAISERSGKIYLVAYDRRIHVLDVETGKAIDTYEQGYRSNSTVLLAQGCLYFTGSGKKLVCFGLIDKKVRWEIRGESSTVHSISFRDGNLYVHLARFLFCIRASDGKVLWQTDIGTGGAAAPILGKDLVYVVNSKGKVYAINAESGDVAWSQPMAQASLAPAVLLNGRLITCDGRGKVHFWK